jgi:hypothetical protein
MSEPPSATPGQDYIPSSSQITFKAVLNILCGQFNIKTILKCKLIISLYMNNINRRKLFMRISNNFVP